MNTMELENLVKQDPVLKKIFLGVFPSDKLPKSMTKPSALIINTDPSYKKGEHWVAVFFDAWNQVEYFDSYGLEPAVPEVIQFISKNVVKYSHNSVCLQSLTSSVCGMYCVFYLFYKSRGYKLEDICNMFTNDAVSNDAIVCNFVSNTFNYSHSVCCENSEKQGCVPFCGRIHKSYV